MFSKVLAKYYKRWYENCLESADYCSRRGDEKTAERYMQDAEYYKKVIDENEEAIEFFSKDDNAFKIDSALPPKFRGYNG